MPQSIFFAPHVAAWTLGESKAENCFFLACQVGQPVACAAHPAQARGERRCELIPACHDALSAAPCREWRLLKRTSQSSTQVCSVVSVSRVRELGKT